MCPGPGAPEVSGCGEGGRAEYADGVVENRDPAVAQVAEGGLGQSGECGGIRCPVHDELVVLVGSRVLLVQNYQSTGNLAHHSGLAPGEGRAEGRDALENCD